MRRSASWVDWTADDVVAAKRLEFAIKSRLGLMAASRDRLNSLLVAPLIEAAKLAEKTSREALGGTGGTGTGTGGDEGAGSSGTMHGTSDSSVVVADSAGFAVTDANSAAAAGADDEVKQANKNLADMATNCYVLDENICESVPHCFWDVYCYWK